MMDAKRRKNCKIEVLIGVDIFTAMISTAQSGDRPVCCDAVDKIKIRYAKYLGSSIISLATGRVFTIRVRHARWNIIVRLARKTDRIEKLCLTKPTRLY